tara:strand:- start:1217 stop:1750 length:534 start_codon:yes stop_codon:yes gene_type:complete
MNSSSKNESVTLNNEVLMNGLLQIYNSHVERMLDNIAVDYNLSAQELKNKYIQENNVDFNIFSKTKRPRKKNKQVTKDELCMARKADSCQCTRRRKAGSDYCGKHINNLKHGRIDDNEEYSNNDKFMVCSITTINGKEYLMDQNNIIYTNDVESPTILGKLEQGNIVNDAGIVVNTD